MSAPVDRNLWISCCGEDSEETSNNGGGYSHLASGGSSDSLSLEVLGDGDRTFRAEGCELRNRLNIE